MKRIAVIDVGTNSVKLLVADGAPGSEPAIVHQDRAITRLGEGLAATGAIGIAAAERTLAALERFANVARSDGAERVAAIGTAALRDASNGGDFLRQADRAGVPIEVIAGEREAELAYRTVRQDPAFGSAGGEVLVFDIGGGSTELVLGSGERPERQRSLPIGAVRLTELCLRNDPPGETEYASARREAERWTSGLKGWGGRAEHAAVGLGGTVTNIASVVSSGAGSVHGRRVTRGEVGQASQRLRALPLSQRRQVTGLEPERADIIIGGLSILESLLDDLSLPSFLVSARGIRYGLMTELLGGA